MKTVIKPFTVIPYSNTSVTITGDMSADIFGQPSDLMNVDNCCYQAVWSGTALVGSWSIQATNDDVNDVSITPTWTTLALDQAATIPASSGDAIFNINQYPGRFIRFCYLATSGTGTLTVKITSKGLG